MDKDQIEKAPIPTWKRVSASAVGFLVFAVIGGVARLFLGPIPLEISSESLSSFLPIPLLLGLAGALVSYCYPRFALFLLYLVPAFGSAS